MDVTIHEALQAASGMLSAIADGSEIPSFFTDPIGVA
jgi:antitoxin (DNA-binding transcriptional repressor) of toxin-antitoxin stability system